MPTNKSVYTKPVVYPYNLNSTSAKLIAAALATKCVRINGTYRYSKGNMVINWGNSTVPAWGTQTAMTHILNKPQYVAVASNKIRTFEQLQKSMPDALPDWTTSMEEAKAWLKTDKYPGLLKAVVARTLTKANSGRGIVLVEKPEEMPKAPLYTRYKPKQLEFRIHVSSKYGIIDAQQKKKKSEVEEKDFNQYIRSHDNGWVFCRDGVKIPELVKDAAEQAIHALNLDFGAVDIGYHPKYGVCLYEVNTAPGLEGQTLTHYVNMFMKYQHAEV